METLIKKLFISLLIISSIVVTYAVMMLIYNFLYHGKPNTDPWVPPTLTSSPTPQSIKVEVITSTESPTTRVDPTLACVHSVSFWSNHTAAWPDQISIGGMTNTRAEDILLYKAPILSINNYLFVQMVAAYLNYNNGSVYINIDKSILAVGNWIQSHPSGSKINDTDLQSAYVLGNTLAGYNNGELGPNLCGNEPTTAPYKLSTQITTPSFTSTFTSTSTPLRIRQPTDIPSNTSIPGRPHPPKPPTPTVAPTHVPVQPTPTQVIKPTNTTEPLPTKVPTTEPLPTPAPAANS